MKIKKGWCYIAENNNAKQNTEKWYFVTKIVLTYCDRKKLLKFETESQDFSKILRSLEQSNLFKQ